MPVRSMYVIMYITLISRRTSQRVFVGLGIAVRWNAGGFGIGIPVQDHTTLAVDHSQEKIHRSVLFVQILTFLSHILTASHGKPS